MRTVLFSDVYYAILRRHVIDPLGDAMNHDTARNIARRINDRVRTVWTAYDWPQLTRTEERAYRRVWNNTTQYVLSNLEGLPDEVYYPPTQLYYQVGGDLGGSPPVGDLPTDTHYWHILQPVTMFVERDQPNMPPMGPVLGVYNSNPSVCNNGVYPPQIGLSFWPSERGITIRDGPVTTVFIQYWLPYPTYTFVPFILGKTYNPGDVVFNTADGNCYQCLMSTNVQAPPATGVWNLQVVPAIFDVYLDAGSFADSLTETFPPGSDAQTRAAQYAAAVDEADKSINGVVNDLAAGGHKHRYMRHSWWHVSWHYDGTIQWPSTGWINSEPWTGNVVYLLSNLTALPAPPVPLPPGATMIYLPQIVSLTSPEPSLKSYPTANLPVHTLVIITIGNQEQTWRLDPGAADPTDPGQLAPLDYNPTTNSKFWRKVG